RELITGADRAGGATGGATTFACGRAGPDDATDTGRDGSPLRARAFTSPGGDAPEAAGDGDGCEPGASVRAAGDMRGVGAGEARGGERISRTSPAVWRSSTSSESPSCARWRR